MITDLVQIRRLEHQKRAENARFRAYLKSHRHSDRRLRRFGEEIEAEIDCTQCANCCRVTEVGINQRDVEKLAKFIGVSEREFADQFTARDAAGAKILKRIPRRQSVQRIRGASAELRELPARGARHRIDCQPHVAISGSRRLLPDHLQLDGEGEGRHRVSLSGPSLQE
jgi:AraC-like DNA-binding protein